MRSTYLTISARILALGTLLFNVGAEAHAQTATTLPEPPVVYDVDRLPPEFHANRRDSVLATLPDNGVAVFLSAPHRNRENDVNYEYRQASDLYYLTGIHEPNSVLILAPAGIQVDGDRASQILLVPPRNPVTEMWTGRVFGPDRARAQLGVATVLANDRFEEIVGPVLADTTRRLYHLPLPEGVEESSTLASQIAVLETHGRLLRVRGNAMVRFMIDRLLSTDTERAFESNQRLLAERLGPETFEGSGFERAYAAYVAADSLAEWLAWKAEHIDATSADGTVLRRRLDQLRVAKTNDELALLRQAIDITGVALREAMKSIEPGMYEYEVEALVEYIFHVNGAESPGYPSIVGSGENTVILHYESNRRRMEAGDLVVMDVGAEYRGYSADVTRTVPVNGTFSPEQKAIYEIVLRAQEAGIVAARAGAPFSGIHRAAFDVVATGLRDLGLTESDRDARRFFMHGTSHYIGLYVHDVGHGGELVPGATLTVEPGIYISPADDIDPKWWNIGVRIEDDVLVTADGPVILSGAAPRTVDDIERLMRERGLGNEAAGRLGASAGRSGPGGS